MAATAELRNEPITVSSEELTPQFTDVPDGFIGTLEVFVRQARDIHNICIYQNQDVFAKLCMTSDPEASVSTKIINGGGRYPVFNENLKLYVRTIDASLKCEIWMLSRVKNYLEDQLLGFVLVPLSQIVVSSCGLENEFSLSSTDLFHSPAGFVSLAISYTGSTPELMLMASPQEPTAGDAGLPDSKNDNSIACEYAKMEFPDPKVVYENKMMISEYLGIPRTITGSQNDECFISKHCAADSPTGDSKISIDNSSSSSSDVPSAITAPNSQIASEPSGISESPARKRNNAESADSDISSFIDATEKAFELPVIKINLEPEQPIVQQEIVDMYMKSMQQFTQSLAKMKLPMDAENGSNDGEVGKINDASERKQQDSKKTSARVFYGSRAFF